MAVKYFKRRWQKALAAVLLVFVLLVTVVAYFVNRYWSPILAARVRSAVLTSTDSLYEASFTNAELHVVQGKLVIHEFTLKPNIKVYRQRLKAGLAPNNLYTLKVKRIVIKQMHPLRLYLRKKLDVAQIVLSAPELQVRYQPDRNHDTVPKNQLNAWQRIRPLLQSVHIGGVLLNDVQFKYSDYSGNRLNITELKEINITGHELLVDSATQNDTARFYGFQNVEFELNNFSRPSDNGLYTYQIKQLRYATVSPQLHAYGVALLPAPDSVFYRRSVRTWFHFDTDTLQLNHFDFKTYNKYRLIKGTCLTLRRGNLVVFGNTLAPPRKTNRLVTFPNVAIKQVKGNFTLDTVKLSRIHITYQALGKRSRKPGMVSFNNTHGYLYNVTNNRAAMQKNNFTRLQLTSNLMDSAPMRFKAGFNLTDSAHSYYYQGSIGSMDMGRLNKAVMPFGLLKIVSGRLDNFNFNIQGNSRVSGGRVAFLYRNLKVHVLKMDTVTGRYKHRGMASLFANALIVKNNDPDGPNLKPRVFKVTYLRQPDTAFFKTIWKTLSKGIKATVGYDEAMEKEVKRHIAQFKADKKNRKIKRALRRQRRALRHQR